MAGVGRDRPRRDPWTAAIHAGAADDRVLGGGVVIDQQRVLTCAHVVAGHWPQAPVWVAFPRAGVSRSERRRVRAVRVAADPAADLAVLVLAEPVPAEVIPAPLSCVEPEDLVGERWWAFGFPEDAPYGSDAHGVVGTDLAYGHVRLDTQSPYPVAPGFSGTGVWSAPRAAVVGLVGQARLGGERAGDAVAVTVLQVDRELPGEKLAALAGWSVATAGEPALAAWGWTLAEDAEAGRHWRPRARGVSRDIEAGWRFRGRTAALNRLVAWLDRPAVDGRVLVVTGSPGVGKSAVLGRVVTTADPGVRAALPAGDQNVTATIGSVACAVHAKGKTALEVATELARAASVRLPAEIRDLVPALRNRLPARTGRRFNVVIDALDEVTGPDQARQIVTEIVLPLAGAGLDAQVVVGTRRRDAGGDLLGQFGPDPVVVDLDTGEFFDPPDLAGYALATLQLVGAERPGSPYADPAVAAPVAARIAALADRNFLVAGLVARRHGQYDEAAVRPEELDFPPDVDDALARYVDRIPPAPRESTRLSKAPPPEPVPATLVLTALAYAQAPGLTLALWRVVLAGLGARVDADDLAEFADSAAANFLVESSGVGQERRFRLFHQALDDALRRERDRQGVRAADERAVADALIEHGRDYGWAEADPYLWRSLPYHADRAGRLDDLLCDDEYLLHADLSRLMPLADRSTSDAGRARARLLRLTPQAAAADPPERAALFSVTAAVEGLGADFAAGHPAPYRARWADVAPRTEWAVLEGHAGTVSAVCPVTVDGQQLLASGGVDAMVRLWDPLAGQLVRELTCSGPVRALCVVTVKGRPRLAIAGDYPGGVRLWDPATGQPVRTLACHGPVSALCPLTVDGRVLLAAASSRRLVVWDAETGHQVAAWRSRHRHVTALCAVEVDGRTLLASGGVAKRIVRLWDPVTGRQVQKLARRAGVPDGIRALCAVEVDGRWLLASAGPDVTLSDPATGQRVMTLEGPAESLAVVDDAGEALLATGYGDVALRDPDPYALTRWHTRDVGVNSLCVMSVARRSVLATGGQDGAVRLWDLSVALRSTMAASRATNPPPVRSLCLVPVRGQPQLAVCGRGGVVLREPTTGMVRETLAGSVGIRPDALCTVPLDGRVLLAMAKRLYITVWCRSEAGHLRAVWDWDSSRPVFAACAVAVDGRTLLATGGSDDGVRLWNPLTGQPAGVLSWPAINRGPLCTLTMPERQLLAASALRTVRLWDPRPGATGLTRETGLVVREWECAERVTALCPLDLPGGTLLATGDAVGGVRVWDPLAGRQVGALPGHTDQVSALCRATVRGRPMLASVGLDRTARVWDPVSETCQLTIPLPHVPTSCVALDDLLIVGLDAGIVALQVDHS